MKRSMPQKRSLRELIGRLLNPNNGVRSIKPKHVIMLAAFLVGACALPWVCGQIGDVLIKNDSLSAGQKDFFQVALRYIGYFFSFVFLIRAVSISSVFYAIFEVGELQKFKKAAEGNSTERKLTAMSLTFLAGVFVFPWICREIGNAILHNYNIPAMYRELLQYTRYIIGFYLALTSLVYHIIATDKLIDLKERRKLQNRKSRKAEAHSCSVERLLTMLNENDILDVVILFNGEALLIRASSDYTADVGTFFDKSYYIGEAEYPTLSELSCALHGLLDDAENVQVISIDGVAPKRYE